MYGQTFTTLHTFERMSNMSDTPAERIAAFLKHTADEEGVISGYVRSGRAYALTREDLAALLAENAELHNRAEQTKFALAGATEANTMLRKGITKTRAEMAELRERIVSDLYDVAEELKQQADRAGSVNRTGQTVLLVKADAYADAAERVRSQS